MTRFPFDIVGFDLDGTLVDTAGDLAAAANAALAAAGRPTLSVDMVRSKVGAGVRTLLTRCLDESGGCGPKEFERYYNVLVDYYAANVAVHSRPFAGIERAFDGLGAEGVQLAVVTNKLESLTRSLLDELGLTGRFACIIGGDTMGPGNAKPSPVPIHAMIERCGGGRAAFVGDSAFDVDAARAAGIPSIAVSFGFLHQPVETLGADAVIDHFDELIPTLRRIGELAA